jgi:hypothetical protein
MVWPSLVVVLGRALGLAIAVPLILIWGTPLHIARAAFALAGLLTVLLAARSAADHGLRLRLHVAFSALRRQRPDFVVVRRCGCDEPGFTSASA